MKNCERYITEQLIRGTGNDLPFSEYTDKQLLKYIRDRGLTEALKSWVKEERRKKFRDVPVWVWVKDVPETAEGRAFYAWLCRQTRRDDDVGMLARDAAEDSRWPKAGVRELRAYFRKFNTADWASNGLTEAWVEFTGREPPCLRCGAPVGPVTREDGVRRLAKSNMRVQWAEDTTEYAVRDAEREMPMCHKCVTKRLNFRRELRRRRVS
jgi:hypothetical protein